MATSNPFTGRRMPRLDAWSDTGAMAVFNDLDLQDFREAEVVRGTKVSSMALWSDWRSIRSARIFDVVAYSSPATGRHPFAILSVVNSGVAGVAEAALVTRDVSRWGGQVARLASGLRRVFPDECRRVGIHRVEARSWCGHPSGGRLLTACGLPFEARLTGFGADGTATFDQHAWTAQQ